MIEFSRIKKITIKEGVVKKITNSSGVVLWKAASDTSGDTSSITVDLNNQWVASTKKIVGYDVYMSNSNKGVANGYASMKFKFKGEPDFKIWISSYAEDTSDYTIAFDMDVDYPTSNPSADSTGVKDHTKYSFGDATSIDYFTEVDYPNDGGEHFVVVTYRKNESQDRYDDRGYVAIKSKPLSTTWVLSSTEFIKDSGKYYQRINEVGTYEGGATALTGNFKTGNELTPTYIQSSDADDYIIVGSGMYYKKYAWVTPVDTTINTGDYIQGDYIGEYKPTVVTYKDGTTKEFDDMRIFPDWYATEVSGATKVELGSTVERLQVSFSSYNQNLTALTFSDRITTIYFRQCTGCKNLSYVKIGSGVNLINEEAFQDCHNLSSVTINNSSAKLVYNTYAFANISSSAKLYVPSNLLSDYQADEKWTGAFPGGIYAIPKNETVVTYSDGTTKEFDITGELTSSSIENISAATKVEIGNGISSIGNEVFIRFSSLSSLTISDSVTSIGDYAFFGTSLSSLTIPDSVTSIGGYAFAYTRFPSLTIPDSVTSIGDYAFAYNGNLASIAISNSITSISDGVFSTTKIISAIIPDSVINIGYGAFSYNAYLESVTIENSTSKLAYNTDAFKLISSSAKLYVPSNLLADYQADTAWAGAFPGGIYAIGS